MAWYKKLHWRIIIGLILGSIYGLTAANMGWQEFTLSWISPWGEIFVNLLKLIAVPLVLASLVTGVASLSDVKKLSRIGGKTIIIYVATTLVAVCIGLLVANVFHPGTGVPDEMKSKLQASYQVDIDSKVGNAETVKKRRPLQPIVDMVPSNFFASAADNGNMLQIVFFAILFGIGLIQVPNEKAKPLLDLFKSLNDVVIRVVDVVMLIAPYGVFALIANTIVTVVGRDFGAAVDLLVALGMYCFVVILGLAIQVFVVYPLLLKSFTPMKFKDFMKGIAPAQLLAFSTSSSGATLPVTMERCEEKLGISEEVSSFVLPLGATINMDGTALYQAVAAIFISQAMGMNLGLGAQITIIFTAVLASIGTAAVPGAGIIMLVIILEAVGVPAAGIGLILGVDRILDMIRTVVNVTGDAAVATVVAASEGQLKPLHLDEEGDHFIMSR